MHWPMEFILFIIHALGKKKKKDIDYRIVFSSTKRKWLLKATVIETPIHSSTLWEITNKLETKNQAVNLKPFLN